ncbi:MAG: undecaprenyl-diphosphate phosphatase [Candidatus Acidiferrales bacterium]
MNFFHVIILAIVQGLAELLPISSSAHVIVAEELMGMNPAAPEMTLLLVMLHTGTMFAVIVYFWQRWRRAFFQSAADFKRFAFVLVLATALTGLVGGALIEGIEKLLFRGAPHAWIEQLFGRLDLIAPALAAAGVLILVAGLLEKRSAGAKTTGDSGMTAKQAGLIGAVQGLCLPFRGFSRSGATISTGMLSGVPKARSEDFSFALAVVLTPAAIAREAWRLIQMQHLQHGATLVSATLPSVLGAFCAFLAGLVALKWLSRWLETGRWYLFGVYCLVAACAVELLHHFGF